MNSLDFMSSGLTPLAATLARFSGGRWLWLWLGFVGVGSVPAAPTILTQPTNQSALVGSSVTLHVSATNSVTDTVGFDYGDLSGDAHTNVFYTGRTVGTLTISYLFGSLNDRLTVYYGTNQIYDTGYVGGSQTRTFTVGYGPGTDTSVTVIINEGNHNNHGSKWEYYLSMLSPLYYQWKFAEGIIPGATNATCTLANVQTNQAGNYQAVVSDSHGTVTSAVASLQVLISPTLTNVTGSSTSFGFAFPTVLGSTYVTQYKGAMNDTNWTAISTNVGTGNLLSENFAVTSALSNRFYRVEVR